MPQLKPVLEVCGNRVVVRNDHYGRMLDGVLRLFEAAKRDFPFLREEEVEVVIYGGDRIKGYMGIEFNVPRGAKIPASYNRVSQLEYTK